MDQHAPEVGSHPANIEIRRFFDLSPDLLAIIDTDGSFKCLNSAWENLLGYNRQALLTERFFNFIHPDDIVFTTNQVEKLMKSSSSVVVENRYRHQDGGYRWLEWTLRYYDQDSMIYAVVRDITEHKKRESALHETEARFRNMADNAAVFVWMTDQTKGAVYFNPSWETFRGHESQIDMEHRWLNGVYPEDAPHTWRIYEDAFMARRTFSMEYRLRRADGEFRWVLASGAPRFTPDGEFLGYVGTCVDIHDRKQAETIRAEYQRQQMELEQAQKIIQMRRHFMSMMSHQFRTPLSVIASSSEMLQLYYDRLSRERQMEKLQVISNQVTSLTAMLEDVVSLTKGQIGERKFDPKPVDLLALCEEVIRHIGANDPNQHQVVFKSQNVPATILADYEMMNQIITALLSNAVMYSPAGSTIDVSICGSEDGITLEIHDQGSAILPEDQEHLFEPFYHLRHERSEADTGLALAIVKQKVEQHGGTITCSSAEGQGTTFKVQLPRL